MSILQEMLRAQEYHDMYLNVDLYIQPHIPEMKAILAGSHLHNFLSVRAFIGKWVGIVASIAGSLSMGR